MFNHCTFNDCSFTVNSLPAPVKPADFDDKVRVTDPMEQIGELLHGMFDGKYRDDPATYALAEKFAELIANTMNSLAHKPGRKVAPWERFWPRGQGSPSRGTYHLATGYRYGIGHGKEGRRVYMRRLEVGISWRETVHTWNLMVEYHKDTHRDVPVEIRAE